MIQYLLLVLGLVLLVKGADILVDSAVKIARHLAVPAIIIGLTIVALGTSAPEATIGIISGFKGANQITLGDVIGSSIINITLIIGLTAMLVPLQVDPLVARREIPLSLGVQLVVTLMLLTGSVLSRSESILLLAGMAAFAFYIGRKTHRMLEWNQPADAAEDEIFGFFRQQEALVEDSLAQDRSVPPIMVEQGIPAKLVIIFLVGLGAMLFGADLTVDASVAIAGQLGLSQEFIGLTLVAFGTSLPELVTCIVAALRKESDIAIGNVVGSNIFNILFALSLSSTLNPIYIEPQVFIDLAVMIGATILLFIPAILWKRISRLSGSILLGAYAIYLGFKIVNLG